MCCFCIFKKHIWYTNLKTTRFATMDYWKVQKMASRWHTYILEISIIYITPSLFCFSSYGLKWHRTLRKFYIFLFREFLVWSSNVSFFLIWLMVYRRGRGDPERQMTVLNLSIKCLQKIYSLYLLFCVQITVTTILSNYLTPHLFSISLKILPIFQLQQRSKGF